MLAVKIFHRTKEFLGVVFAEVMKKAMESNAAAAAVSENMPAVAVDQPKMTEETAHWSIASRVSPISSCTTASNSRSNGVASLLMSNEKRPRKYWGMAANG